MLCPEGENVESIVQDEFENNKKSCEKDAPQDNSELRSFKNPRTWKKSLTNFFRQQLRSTKSNEGERPSDSKESFEDKDISPELKWQSLGKVFRRQSFIEHWGKGTNEQGECSSQSKRLAVRKVLSNYFGKSQKSVPNEKQ